MIYTKKNLQILILFMVSIVSISYANHSDTIKKNGNSFFDNSIANWQATNPPVNSVPTTQTLNENTSITLRSVSVADTDRNLVSVRITVLNGDFRYSSRAARFVTINGPGDITISGSERRINGMFRALLYRPNFNFTGTDTFTIVSSDNSTPSLTDTDSFDIIVTPFNHLPDAVDDTTTVDENSIEHNINVLRNDNFNNDRPSTGTITTFSNTSLKGGIVLVNDNSTPNDPSDDSIAYTPLTDFDGQDSFEYLITDFDGDTDTATVNITVNNVPNPCKDDAIVGTVTANDADADGINNICDLDDDNDGILDSEECSNLLLSGGFETLPNLNFGNNINVNIAPWTLGAGDQANIVKVDGAGGFNYGNSGPFEDANIASGSGVIQHYLDIAGVNDFYQAFTITEIMEVKYSGYFSSRDNRDGEASISIYSGGSGATGTLVDAISAIIVEANGSSGNTPWEFVENTITLTPGTYSYVVGMSNPTNFDQATVIATLCDTDLDGTPDNLDLDSDGDGCSDVLESGGIDANNDGVLDGTGFNINGLVTGGTNGYNGTEGNEVVAHQMSITTLPSNQISAADQSVSFSVVASSDAATSYNNGSPIYGSSGNASSRIKYQWYLGNPENTGTLINSSNGNYTGFDSATLNIANVNGLDNKEYYLVVTHTDNICLTQTLSATLTVFTLVNDIASTNEDNPLIINTKFNDIKIPTTGTIAITTNATNGNVVITDPNNTPNKPGDDVVTYTPNLNFSGTDTFEYTICTTNGICDTALVTITVNEDTDEDGIADIVDLDDDNDGILDTDEGCSNTTQVVSNFSINRSRHSASLNTASNGFGIDITRLDNSFSIVVNGIPLFSNEVELASAYSPILQGIIFADGTRHGKNGLKQIWSMGAANASTPLLRLTVNSNGDVQFLGSKTLNGPLEPMILTNGLAVNPITWNQINTIEIDQVINGQTYAIGSIYGFNNDCSLDTDNDGIPNSLDTDSDDDGCFDALEGGNTLTTTSLDANGQLTGGVDANGIPNLVTATGQTVGTSIDNTTQDADCTSNTASIGDTVWYDTDGDGIKDANENGLGGATVSLDPGTPADFSDDVTTTTALNGTYLFDNLSAETYTVTVDLSTVTSGIPAGKTIADLIPIFDGDGVGTANKSSVTLASGENNLDQDFAYIIPSGNSGTGNNGGIESESLGDALTKLYIGRKKNSVPTEFVKSGANLYNKSQMISKQPYQGKGQTMLDMFPTQLVAGNVANITSPTDILDITTADEVLSVDFSLDGETKGVVLGIKTSDKIYNHTKASCDRLRGAEILNIQTIEIEGYNFLMQGIKQRNGIVEYAISFATAKNNNDANYTIQTNWYVNNYIKFNDVYNFQVWSTKPADTQKLVTDVLKNLQSFIPVTQTEIQKIPETYASKIYRDKAELVVNLRSTEVGNTADISMVELYSETANNIKHRYNSLDTEIQQSLRVAIADGYEYDALVKVNGEVEDAFYHADGNWGLDYDKRYTEVNNYFVWNDFDREYKDEEHVLNRNIELKATSEYDYLTVYKSLLPGTISADYSEYKYVAFTATGSGLMELGLVKSSIEDWRAQYRVMVDFSKEEQTYYVPFDVFTSSANQNKMTVEDLTTLTFTFLPVEAQTKELDLTISNVRFTKTAVEGQIINKIQKFENEFMAYPNPSKGNVNLVLFSETDTEATVTLSDITGKTVYKGKAQLTVGKNELEYNFKIKTGLMLLQVNSNETNYGTSKILFR